MNPKLENYLKKKFPKLYTECGEQQPFTLFAFECDDGWFRIILWLSRYLQSYIDQQNEWATKYPDQYLPVKQIKVVQVKEKFATLRFYVEGGNERTNAIISYTEYISGFVCESTGRTDNIGVNKRGWLKTQHIDISKDPIKYKFVDDKELTQILWEVKQEKSNQLYFDL